MTKIKNQRGKQHRTKFMEKHYIALLKKHGRLTVKQLFKMTCECEFTARRRLVKLKKDFISTMNKLLYFKIHNRGEKNRR